MQTTYAVNMMVRCATEIETTMVSAERIHEYSNIPTEVTKENSGFFIENKRIIQESIRSIDTLHFLHATAMLLINWFHTNSVRLQ